MTAEQYNPRKNSEGYSDPTAYYGMKDLIREEELMDKQVNDLVHIIKTTCNLAGYEVIGRIQFKHKKTGKEFR